MNDLTTEFNDNSLYRTMGIALCTLTPDGAEAELDPEPSVCWPFQGQPHGGVLFTLMDTTMAFAVIGVMGSEYSSATISLNIQYTARAKAAPYRCHAKVSHSTKNVSFVRSDIVDATGQVVAMGQGTFKIIHPGR